MNKVNSKLFIHRERSRVRSTIIQMNIKHLSLLIPLIIQFHSFFGSNYVVVESFSNINLASFTTKISIASRRNTARKISNMMMVQNNENKEASNLFDVKTKTTLAASYIIYTQDGATKYEPTTWTLMPLEQVIQTTGESDYEEIGVGSMAVKALQSSLDHQQQDYHYTMKLICNFVKQDCDDAIEVTTVNSSHEHGSKAQDNSAIVKDQKNLDTLIATLSRVMVQKKAKDFGISSSSLSVSLPSMTGTKVSETFEAMDILSSNGCSSSLYHSLLPSNSNLKSIEMSDMVDSSGIILGSIPRLLVHKLNILHRGIGIVVCNNEHITQNDDAIDMVEIYCHRRTDTKRIFPSLYDMFVGGVSISGEGSTLTAAREVAEELGLDKGLNYIESTSSGKDFDTTSPLSDPLFKCTVCTSYNRCVVTVFTYKYLSSDENIKWQEEEVSWGDFVPYHIVEQAAAMSINRLIKDDKWPGGSDDFNFDTDGAISNSEMNSNWKEWDFVPDGLLVWVAWLQWLQNNK